MTNLISTPKTMSSEEIASLLEMRHDNVRQVVKNLAESKLITFTETTVKGAGRPKQVMHLNERDSIVVSAKLNDKLMVRIIDRWQELERGQQFNIPQTLPEALQLAADLAKEIEQAKPKLEVYEALADRKGDVSTTILAKQLGMTAIKLNKKLRELGIKWEKADLPKAGYQDWFNVVADVKNGHEFTQCLITPDGQIEITKLINKEGK